MIFDKIYIDVVSSFGGLWSFKERENSLEIITPFATTSHKFVSVFVTQRGDDFIVSDGGWVADGSYGSPFDRNIDCYAKIILHYLDNFQVRETSNLTRVSFFYKKTDKQIAVPSLILDMANFISSIVSLSEVEYEVERKTYDLFSRTANVFLSDLFVGKFETNVYFDLTTRHVKPNAIIKKDNGKVLLVNYITGSNLANFKSSIGKTTVIFELAEKSILKDKIDNKVTFVDDFSTGFGSSEVGAWLDNLSDKPRIKRIDWSKKEEFSNI